MSDQLTQPKEGSIGLRHLLEEKRKLSQDSRDMRDSTIQNNNFLIVENLLQCNHLSFGYHTRKIPLPVIPLTVPVTLPVPVQ